MFKPESEMRFGTLYQALMYTPNQLLLVQKKTVVAAITRVFSHM